MLVKVGPGNYTFDTYIMKISWFVNDVWQLAVQQCVWLLYGGLSREILIGTPYDNFGLSANGVHRIPSLVLVYRVRTKGDGLVFITTITTELYPPAHVYLYTYMCAYAYMYIDICMCLDNCFWQCQDRNNWPMWRCFKRDMSKNMHEYEAIIETWHQRLFLYF